MKKQDMLALLHQNVVPALGCTEPVCVAIAAADAVKAVGGQVQRISLELSRNVYKNSMSVGIPGFERVGLKYAAALGAYIADPCAGLEVFQAVTDDISARAIALADRGGVDIAINEEERGVYVRCTVDTDQGEGVSVIRGAHTNIVLTQANGSVLRQEQGGCASAPSLADQLNCLRISEIRELAASATEDELAFLLDGVEMNQSLAEYGLENNPGIGIAGVLRAQTGQALLGTGLLERIMLKVAAATEARLEGCPHATMSSSGSGSKGIAVILPVTEVAKAVGASRADMLRALAFAHLLNDYLNSHIGKLSAICACAMCSATAASAANTWLMGGTDEQIGWAIRNMAGSITGMICDGGKVGCSLKLSTATAAGMMSAILAINNVSLRPTDGICAESPEDCIRNMGRVSNPGMLETDKEILRIMLDKNK